jgi:hypothetical protein
MTIHLFVKFYILHFLYIASDVLISVIIHWQDYDLLIRVKRSE